MQRAAAQAPATVRRAIRQAARHIARVALPADPATLGVNVTPGVSVEQRVEPLARVGCYVPGGRFPLPSSLLMTAVPARVAGVREIVVCCPRPEPVVMAAALEAGVTRLFRIGGAHAIAALAYGTADGPARGQDRRARESLRRRREGARLARLRDRLFTPGRPRSSSSRRRGGPTGSPPISSRRPSTIRMRDRFSSRGSARSPRAWRRPPRRGPRTRHRDERRSPRMA